MPISWKNDAFLTLILQRGLVPTTPIASKKALKIHELGLKRLFSTSSLVDLDSTSLHIDFDIFYTSTLNYVKILAFSLQKKLYLYR